MKWRATILGGFALGTLAVTSAGQAETSSDRQAVEQVWLDAHNAARADFGTAPLSWNSDLAEGAKEWALRLARESRLRHSSHAERQHAGENLWMGTKERFAPDRMIAAFTDEKQHFRAGTFPAVSATGSAKDVGHYTQIVWADTREVGCATARGARFDVLVCRYWPAGNVIGTPIAPRTKVARRQTPN